MVYIVYAFGLLCNMFRCSFSVLVNPESPTESPTPAPTPPAEAPDSNSKETPKEKSMDSIQEDSKEDEAEDEEGLPVFPYDRLTTPSTDPAAEIEITKREVLHFSHFH